MQQKFSPERAGLPGWTRQAEMRLATVGGPARPRGALLLSVARRVQADTCGGARRSVSQQNAAGAMHNMQVFTFFGLKRKQLHVLIPYEGNDRLADKRAASAQAAGQQSFAGRAPVRWAAVVCWTRAGPLGAMPAVGLYVNRGTCVSPLGGSRLLSARRTVGRHAGC